MTVPLPSDVVFTVFDDRIITEVCIHGGGGLDLVPTSICKAQPDYPLVELSNPSSFQLNPYQATIAPVDYSFRAQRDRLHSALNKLSTPLIASVFSFRTPSARSEAQRQARHKALRRDAQAATFQKR